MTVHFKSDNVQKHKDLADTIKSSLEVTGATIKEKEGHGAYYANLPEGVTRKEVEALSTYNGKFVTAAHVAVGELSAEIFHKDSKVDQVEASVGFFGKSDSVDISVSRSKTYQNHLADEGEDKDVVKHLVMKTTVSSQSAKGYGLKAVRDSMSKEFADSFKK